MPSWQQLYTHALLSAVCYGNSVVLQRGWRDVHHSSALLCIVVLQAVQQAQEVAWDVQQQQPAGAGISADFHEQCAWLMDHVMLRHLELCFGVHMAVVVACVVYVTAKVQQATLPLSTITQVSEQRSNRPFVAGTASVAFIYSPSDPMCLRLTVMSVSMHM